MQSNLVGGFILAAGLVALPLLAPADAVAATTNYTSTAVTHGSGATMPSDKNPLLTDNGSVRVGKLIGTNVYNSKDKKLGSVDGVVINKAGEPQVIISHNDKLVAVPWNKLQFGNAQQNGDNKVMISDMTPDQLNGMQAFNYTAHNNR
jgi:hypothetical protein